MVRDFVGSKEKPNLLMCFLTRIRARLLQDERKVYSAPPLDLLGRSPGQ
jgi:hypothetical protein